MTTSELILMKWDVLMPDLSSHFLFRTIRWAYSVCAVVTLICLVGAYHYWPGAAAWLFIAVGVCAGAAALVLTQILSRIRLVLWLLPMLERLRKKPGTRGLASTDERTARRGLDAR